MSAANWGKCPKCCREENLREDYELGMWSGKFTVSYHAECGYRDEEGCGYRFEFKMEIDPFSPAHVLVGRVTNPTLPKPVDPAEEQRKLREQALTKLTPEERAALTWP